MKRGTPISVRWLDIVEEWADDAAETVPAEFVTRGYFLERIGKGKSGFLRMSCSWSPDGSHYGCIAIPLGCVLDISRQ